LTRKLKIVWYRWKIGIGIDGIFNENPDTGSTKRIVNRMGSEDLVERRIELFQRSETETLTVGSGGKLGEINSFPAIRVLARIFYAYFLLVKNTR
jgi:hypothetical protein